MKFAPLKPKFFIFFLGFFLSPFFLSAQGFESWKDLHIYYKKNNFGIRIENLIFVKKNKKDIYFDNLTLVPIEKELINYKLLSSLEKDYLFKYHLNVYSKISKYLNFNERKWLASFVYHS